jgi:hypothetical protein
MRSLIDRYNKRLIREAKQKEADRILDERLAKKCENVDVTMLYTLHTVFGFGAERCRRFYFEMIDNHFNMCNRWQCDGDDSHYWIMKQRLKDDGIDVEAMIKEAQENAKWREKNEN